MAKPKAGIQLIVYGARNRTDLPAVLREVADAGYAGFEAGNLFAMHPESEVRSWLAGTGLQACGAHAGFADLCDDAKVDAALAYLNAVDSRFLMCSGVGNHSEGAPAYDRAAERFNHVGEKCRAAGVTFCYHNHNWEFTDVGGGEKAIHRLAAHTDPALVKLCIDVYWVHVGGEPPADFIRRYRDRAAYFHFKDGAPGKFTELGRGEVDYAPIMAAIADLDVEWAVYEQDRTEMDPGESARISRQFMRDRLGL